MTAKNRNKLVGSFFVLFFIGVIVLLLNAQATYNWRFQSAAGGVSATGNSVWYHVNAAPTSFPKLAWTLTGSLASCTIQIDFSNDGSTVAGQAVAAQTCTTSGTFTSGSSSVYNYVRASYVIGSGGGSISYIGTGCITSTCTSGGGSGTPGGANTNVQYNSTGTFAGNAGLTYDASHTLGVGGVGLGNGVISLGGNTSGASTITGPAVGGTSTNPDIFSNVIQVPVGALNTPSVQFGSSLLGLYGTAAPGINFQYTSGIIGLLSSNTNFEIPNTSHFAISSTNTSNNAATVGISSIGANTATIDNGTVGTDSGLLRTGDACRITADVSLTVNTANSFCSYTLPAVAKAWAFNCDIQWAITAGSGTNTFALGVNASQTPTGTTNGIAQIYTTTTGTQTLGSTAISASGATSILTGATYTPAATVQMAHISGTVLASATAGTFAITATANGTTATAAVKAGSQCQIF